MEKLKRGKIADGFKTGSTGLGFCILHLYLFVNCFISNNKNTNKPQ